MRIPLEVPPRFDTDFAMHPRAAELIAALDLRPHPEGGFYRQIFRSAVQVTPMDRRGSRAALTTIYFLLPEGSFSRWHRVRLRRGLASLRRRPAGAVGAQHAAQTLPFARSAPGLGRQPGR
jgi:predicted cupin superfamily sugar epimerase